MLEHQTDVRKAYRLLVDESLVPGDPTALMLAAAESPDASDPWRLIDRMARSVGDPHTMLLGPRMMASLMAMTFGKPAANPGFAVHRSDGAFVVGDVTPRGAAAACGLSCGDTVLALDDEPLERGMTDVLMLAGRETASDVSVLVKRDSTELRLTLSMSEVQLPLTDTKLFEGNIGYVRLRMVTSSDEASRDGASLVASALDELTAARARALVLDLRSNPGGWGVTRIASLFTDASPIAIYRSRSGEDELAERQPRPALWQRPLAVLINEQSNSSAEIIALALRELCGALIVGQPSAGGLTVPRYEPLSDGYALMFPERHALGPRSLEPRTGHRVAPDIVVPNPSPADFAEGRDPQLLRALEALRQGR